MFGEAMDETTGTAETTGGDRRDRSTTHGIVLAVIFSIPVAMLIGTILSDTHELSAGTLAGLTASIEGQIAEVEAYAPPHCLELEWRAIGACCREAWFAGKGTADDAYRAEQAWSAARIAEQQLARAGYAFDPALPEGERLRPWRESDTFPDLALPDWK